MDGFVRGSSLGLGAWSLHRCAPGSAVESGNLKEIYIYICADAGFLFTARAVGEVRRPAPLRREVFGAGVVRRTKPPPAVGPHDFPSYRRALRPSPPSGIRCGAIV
ncbi:uncharacterized protein LY79DRAFT_111631 [Colletotrichum navitas]|uniref:Uncharacterized protein n=1 Tax=Colletotrichum navitas TaxID=681940 RepID=A0AAD8Q4C8_9PEZI|nr:uncharacterized protein LY79DRAFT_111631 [Colletotrichum navitas]KAK1595375.1 hypothetical protein LY79DRAFT_111631 [Colletotrichum navitas]